ncbi:MAG: MopE-related protein [Chitinophagales bacterium]
MKTIYLLFILLFFFNFSFSQAPEIEWQNDIGGNDYDQLQSIGLTSDGGYIIGGESLSDISGDKTEGVFGIPAYYDYWVLKLDSLGVIEWQNTIGGSQTDILYTVEETRYGGYILGGWTSSGISGDKTEASLGSFDIWIVKLDSFGNILWQNTIGGDSYDALYSIEETSDNGFILGATSSSGISGDKTEASWPGGSYGYDFWVLKLNSIGEIEWQNTIGGTGDDQIFSIHQTSKGGYIIGGDSYSGISGDKTEPSVGLGYSDYWVVMIDSIGNIQWQNTIGGSDNDHLRSIDITSDGGFILGGYSISNISGDKTEGNIGYDDYWVLKLDSVGNIVWQNTIGGTANDDLATIEETIDGGYIIGGASSSSISADKSENGHSWDYWVVKINSTGEIIWDNTIWGEDLDILTSLHQSLDGGYVMGGYTYSGISGDKTEPNWDYYDYWIVKLFPECTTTIFYADFDEDGFGDVSSFVEACTAPLGYVTDNTDCNDSNNLVYPGAPEICNDMDDNCNFLVDESLPLYTYYFDADEDGFGDMLTPIITCDELPPLGYVIDSSDCDDNNFLFHELVLYYSDLDGDLFGDILNSAYFCTFIPPTGYVTNSIDCDDENILINPVSNEICNNIDDNCNIEIDEGLPTQILYNDEDGDNYGNAIIDTITCFLEIDGFVEDNTDCDDSNPNVYPGAPEILDGLDNDCNEIIDDMLNIDCISDIEHVTIYPVPAHTELTIHFNTDPGTEVVIRLTDIFGNAIYMTTEVVIQTNILINVKEYSPGLYFLDIQYKDHEMIYKLIIE